ncbi:MAG TPA: NAD(P)/FAD-dependent oxidoreductase [Gemmatimonadaceae bacterium]|nr:NAD(P)/FAD-dependent oxidoreductase [Gemmatimonadaceae bacterium]
MESVEHLVIGAGPAGLRAAQLLAERGREVLVLEKHEEIGPKTCAGGLTRKSVRELEALGLPRAAGLELLGHASFAKEGVVPLDADHAVVRTLARRALGAMQAAWTRAAGAEIRTSAPVSRIDLDGHTAEVAGKRVRYRHVIGADGSASAVRRALGLPSPRTFYAAEYNVPGIRLPRLLVAYDSAVLANGYFWIFPHEHYTSVGAGGHKRLVPPSTIKPYLERRLRDLNVDGGSTPYEGATIEVEHHGFDFPRDVHLVGDAAGVASGLTGEGIYPALVSGEEVARGIVEPHAPRPKTRAWLRLKRVHDVLGRLWLDRRLRNLSFAALPWLCTRPLTRRWVSAFFLEG